MRILLCAGTRPNFVKIAPLYHQAIELGVEVKILHTGQHYDYNLNQVFFDQLEIPDPDVNLEISSSIREEYIQAVAAGTKEYISKNNFDYVITVGDVNSTLGCTKGAKLANVRVAHVEAGLRSHDMDMPEEINRLEIDSVADLKFVSEPDGITNLKNEGLYTEDSCFLVGNVVIDNLINNLSNIEKAELPADLHMDKGSYCLVTMHRPSNVDDTSRLKMILEFLDKTAEKFPVVFPVHPRTQSMIKEFGYENLTRNLLISSPLGYFQFLHLLKNSKFIITDSGGAQEESSFFNIPCITTRSNTERPITLLSGTSFLVGKDMNLLDYYTKLAIEDRLPMGSFNYELWDGQASQRIIEILKEKS